MVLQVSDEKDARGYLQALAQRMNEELDWIKLHGKESTTEPCRPLFRCSVLYSLLTVPLFKSITCTQSLCIFRRSSGSFDGQELAQSSVSTLGQNGIARSAKVNILCSVVFCDFVPLPSVFFSPLSNLHNYYRTEAYRK